MRGTCCIDFDRRDAAKGAARTDLLVAHAVPDRIGVGFVLDLPDAVGQ